MDKDREARYTWDESNAPELVEEGDGEELDLSALVARAEVEAGKAKAKDSDGPSIETNNSKGMALYHAMPIGIETAAGDSRSGITPDGKAWLVNMPADYGFIHGYIGADGDSIDCYVGNSPESNSVFVVDQYDLDGQHFDEHKCMLGYHTRESALDDYAFGHHKSDVTFAACTEFTMPMFRRWLATADLTQPCSDKVRR